MALLEKSFVVTWQVLAILHVVDTDMDEQDFGHVIEDEKELMLDLINNALASLLLSIEPLREVSSQRICLAVMTPSSAHPFNWGYSTDDLR